MLSASYQDQEPMWDSKRDLSRYPRGPRHPGDGWGMGPWGNVTDPRPAGTPGAGAYDPTTGNWNPNHYVINHGNLNSGDLADYHLYNGSNADKYNSNQDMTFRAGTTLKNLFLQERYQLTDNITLRGTASYSSRNSSSQLAGYPFSGTLAPDSPYNPFPGYETPFSRRITELPRTTWANSRLMHVDVGADGYFNFLDHEWNWDATYNYSQTRIKQTTSGNLYLPNVNNAINPILGPDGRPACADPSGGCTPWNIPAGPGATPQSVLDYVNYVGTARQTSQTSDFTANVGGGLWDIPHGGTLSIAGGFEHRREKGTFTPDPNDAAGLTTNLASDPTSGRYNVNEVYLELDAPVLKDLPGIQEFGVNIASRYSHYSSFGSTTNNKYSVRWRPISDLLVRGTFAKGFRAPTLQDLYGGSAQSFEPFLDPCDSVYGAAVSNPAVAARCRTSGVPAGYRQKDQAGTPITSNGGGQTPVPFNDVSNPNLKPERSTTRTFGLVYSPHYIEGLDITVDYYDIRLKNTITSVNAANILDYCYVQNVQSYCNLFTRNANGEITQLDESLYNLGSLNTQGYDVGIHYRLPETPIGQFRISSDSTYLTKYQVTTAPGAIAQDQAGFMDGEDGLYRLRSNLQLDWSYKQFGASWTVRYFSGLKDSCYSNVAPVIECGDPTYTNPWIGSYGIAQKGSVAFNDAQVRYNTPWKGAVSLGVNNLFNRQGPYYYNVTSASSSPPYNPQFDVGRFFYLQYNQKFDL
ncbi:TonB-dependent receptor domain-containing protein [Dyella flagellata]|uniref:TonB-dependent receptor n=1 Tax=Dyella flagellata TaxID=1867833 RepID=A0ABQ5X9W5_9GAMM|nr:TonB-dependent receptor [Dyella flagellata]GLQ88424.1 TonB-dependent receptor [Dyella flagellata]